MDHELTEIIHGGCRGVDSDAAQWAKANQIPTRAFPADWKTHGKAAGPIRNREMARYADAVALFPGGVGTANMRNEAEKMGLKIFDFR